MRVLRKLLVLCSLALVLEGCPPTSSCDIRTSGLYAIYTVTEAGSTATVQADMRVSNFLGNVVELCDGDQITVNGTILTLISFPFAHYRATVPTADNYLFQLTREGEDPYTSTVASIQPVQVTAPAEGATVSRQDGFAVTWEDPDLTTAMNYSVILNAQSETCSVGYRRDVDGAATYMFTGEDFAEDVLDGEGQPTGETSPVCEGLVLTGTIQVETSRAGTMDDDLNGSISTYALSPVVNITLQP